MQVENTRPRLKAVVMLPPQSGSALVCLKFGSRAFDLSVSEGDPALLIRLLGHLNGAYTPKKIAESLGLSLEMIRDVLDQLIGAGLVYDYNQASLVKKLDPEIFVSSVQRLTSAFRIDMFRHPLFAQLSSRDDLFLAAAIEYGHVIRQASRHIGRAHECAPPRLKKLLAEYLESEKDHYIPIELAISEALSTSFQFDCVLPLAATEALILKTYALAETNTLAYIACCGAFEAEQLPESVETDRWSPKTSGVYEVFRRHAQEDCDSSHSTLLHQAVQGCDDLTSDEFTDVCNSIHTYKHFFDNLNDELLHRSQYENVAVLRLTPKLDDFV